MRGPSTPGFAWALRPGLRLLISLWLCTVLPVSARHRGPDLQPYAGMARGDIAVYFDEAGGQSIVADVVEVSNQIGKGRQVYTSLDLSEFPARTSGTCESVDRSGDRLFISFMLSTVGQTPQGVLLFEGEFTVTGGTGRYQFGPALPSGDFGRGKITGRATLDTSQPGRVVLSFRDHFAGVLTEFDDSHRQR